MTREDIQNSARKLIGAPWHHQGRDLVSGIDCIGGIIFVCKDTHYKTEEEINTSDRLDYSRNPDGYSTLVVKLRENFDEISVENIKEGDVLTFRMAGEKLTSHVGILVKGERELMIVHSLERKITIEDTYKRWAKYATHAFRFRNLEEN